MKKTYAAVQALAKSKPVVKHRRCGVIYRFIDHYRWLSKPRVQLYPHLTAYAKNIKKPIVKSQWHLLLCKSSQNCWMGPFSLSAAASKLHSSTRMRERNLISLISPNVWNCLSLLTSEPLSHLSAVIMACPGEFIMFADKVTMWNTNPFETSPCWQVHLPQFFVALAAIPFVPAAGCFSKPSAVQTLKHQPGTTQEREGEVNKNTIPSQDWQDWQATFCCFESNLWH